MAIIETFAWPEGKPPATANEFFDCLDASGVLSAHSAREVLHSLPPDQLSHQPESLASALLVAGKLTRLQSRAILAGKVKYLTFGEYVVLEKLGQGGMGKVYKAEHRRMKRLVALKVMTGAALKLPEAVRRFEREVQVAARLIHPNIVTAFDANEHAGVHYFVMEYVAGRDLNSILAQRGTLPIDTAVNYILQAAKGLAYAHSQGVIHRDVKPGNLLVDKQGSLKILDLGLARLHQTELGTAELTGSGQVMGTIDYMAPEQAEDTHSADARADIYSLGCTLYRLVTGAAIYGGDTVVRKLLAHREAPIPSLAASQIDMGGSTHDRLDAIFRKMVAKRPADRQASMAEVVDELEAWLRDAPPSSTVNTLEATTAFTRTSSNAAPAERTATFSASDTQPSLTLPSIFAPPTSPTARRQTARKIPAWRRGILIGTALAGLALVVAGITFFIPTAEGTIRVEINDPSIEVTVSESGYKIQGQTAEIQLRPGEKTLHVQAGDLAFDTTKFVIGQGKNPDVVVELLPGELRVVQAEKVLGRKRRATKPAIAQPAPEPTPSKPTPVEPTPLTPIPQVDELALSMAKMPPPEIDGSWQLQDGGLIVPVDRPTRMFYLRFGDPNWTDYDVQVNVTVHERWPAEFGVLAHAAGSARWQFIVGGFADMSNRDLLPFTNADDGWGSPARRFLKNQERVRPASTSLILLRVRGPQATSFLDGKQISTSEQIGLVRGRAGICTFGNTRFTDIEVRDPDGKLLWRGLPDVGTLKQRAKE